MDAAAAATSVAMGGNGGAATGGYDKSSAAAAAAASSAFSPIQAAAAGSMLNSSGFSMHSSRNYFYDPLSFPKHHSQVRNHFLFNFNTNKSTKVLADVRTVSAVYHISKISIADGLRVQDELGGELLPEPVDIAVADQELRAPAILGPAALPQREGRAGLAVKLLLLLVNS